MLCQSGSNIVSDLIKCNVVTTLPQRWALAGWVDLMNGAINMGRCIVGAMAYYMLLTIHYNLCYFAILK